MDHPRKIGLMQQNNCDPGDKPIGLALGDESCPKCGTEMEPIDIEVADLPVRQLQLCPECYLVTWMDDTGFQVRQGVPMNKGQASVKKGQASEGWAAKPN
jgi:hypothetical protein